MQFGRGIAWIVGAAVIGVVALIHFGLDGTERKETPPEDRGTLGSEAVDPSSPAGAGTHESRPAAARESDRRAVRGRPDRGSDDLAGEAIPYEEGSSRGATEWLDTEGRTEAGARAPRPGTGFSGTSAGERDDEGDQGWGGLSDPTGEEVSVVNQVMVSCAMSPVLCNVVSPDNVGMWGTISVVSDGTAAILMPLPNEPDVVYIRTGDGVMIVTVDNLTTPDQLDALVQELVPHR